MAWVESPLQLIAAAEYAAFHGRAIDVAMRLSGPQMPITAQALLDRRALFSSVAPYYGIPWGLLSTRRSWIIGDGFSGQFQTAMSTLGARAVTLLDDGILTLRLARALGGTAPFHRPGHRPSARRGLIASLARDRMLALAARESLSFFSVFADHDALRMLGPHGIPSAPNEFAWLRASGRPAELPGTALILGAAAVADGSMSAERYLKWVRTTVREAGRPVCYLPHRRQSRAMLGQIAALAHVTVVELGMPVELLLAGTDRALDIVTLPSTAAITLRTLLAGTGSTIRTDPLRASVR